MSPIRSIFQLITSLVIAVSIVALAPKAKGSGVPITYPNAQIRGENGWNITPLFTIGEVLPTNDWRYPNGYQPVGVLDGIGAYSLNTKTVRMLVNHELLGNSGRSYALKNGTILRGSRISFFDIDRKTRKITNSGLAYDMAFDRQYQIVTDPAQINENSHRLDGFSRFCSSNLVQVNGKFAFVDDIYFTHEEMSNFTMSGRGGSLWALHIQNKTLHAVPAAGRLNWENTAALSIPDPHVAFLITDDWAPRLIGEEVIGAPLWLYIGEKNASLYSIKESLPHTISPPKDTFLNRNGLLVGKLWYFVSDNGHRTVVDFRGTGNVMQGYWREIHVLGETKAGTSGYDALGYKDGLTLRKEAKAGGAFQFSRPEDVSSHPTIGQRAVFASTGIGNHYNEVDHWGTTYKVNVNFDQMKGTLKILYDGDDAQHNQMVDPDHGLRNPDNLDWADNGMIYIQEDKPSEDLLFGISSGKEASIWELDPFNSTIKRIAQIDRSVIVPRGSTDLNSNNVGFWESSGILDVTGLFPTEVKERLLIANVQAHSIQDGLIHERKLVESGQLFFLSDH